MNGMLLVGTGKRITDEELRETARENGIQASHLFAVRKVEAPRGPFDSNNRLTALWEYHIFYRYLPKAKRQKALDQNLARSRWGQLKYGSYNSQYDKFDRGRLIDSEAAYRSMSYGSYQTMGFNAKLCGYRSAELMVDDYRKGEAQQTIAVLNFIKANQKRYEALQKGDWHTFARLYNGSAYKKHRYHVRLANAEKLARRHNTAEPLDIVPPEQRKTMVSDTVKEAQEQLIALGYDVGPSGADGKFGPDTKAAILKFQRTHPNLANDGKLGTETMTALDYAISKKADEKAVSKKGAGAIVGTVAGVVAAWQFLGLAAWQFALIGVALAVVVGLLIWRHRSEYEPEIQQAENIKQGVTVNVEPIAERVAPPPQANHQG